MNTSSKKIIQKILAIVVIFTMTMADLSIVGTNLISYAADLIEVNNKNVSYNVYFEDENKTLETTKKINEKDLKLAIELNVENDGYLTNGKIELEEGANFKFKTDSQDSHISKIEERVIYLKQINESDNIKIQVGVEFADTQEMSLDYLSKTSVINLSGIYINSRNIESNKSIEIKGKANAKINWLSPDELKSNLDISLLNNSTYKIDEEDKHIVQLLVTSKVENNTYPIKNTNIELNISNTIQNVSVNKRTTSATNGNRDFNYDYKDGIITIKVENGIDNKILWAKDAMDEFVVTMEYPQAVAQEVSITEPLNKINVKSTLVTYDNKELNQEKEIDVRENKEGAVTVSVAETSKEIAKGKIYTGEDKNYTEVTSIQVNYAKPINEIELEEEKSSFVEENTDKDANIEFVQTKISKDEFLTLFGEEGTLNIKDNEGNVIATITKETETTDGKYIIKYNSGITGLKITTSKPATEGILNIENEKVIKKTEYSRNELQAIKQIKDSSKVLYKIEGNNATNQNSSTLGLKEPETKATMKVEPSTISTSQEQELHITIDLETNNEERELFKEPELKINVPNQLRITSAQAKLLYGNGLHLEKGNFKIEEGKAININLTGEQTNYPGEAVNGTQLLILAKVEPDRLATNSEEEIVFNYTNHISEANTQSIRRKINIVSEDSIILTNQISAYKVNTIGIGGEKEIELENVAEAKNANVKMQIINNESSEISNVAILGKIANKEGKIERTSAIKVDKETAKVYYTEVEQPTTDINETKNAWTTENIKNAKNYLVIIEKLDDAEKVTLDYNISISKDLGYNVDAETEYTVSYKNTLTEAEKQAKSTKIILTTGKVAEVKLNLEAQVGEDKLKNGDEVKAGEIITYTAKLTNAGREKAENVTLTADIPENTTLVEINPQYLSESGEGTEVEEEQPYFIEKADKQIKKDGITLESNKTITYKYMVKVNSDLTENKNAKMKVIANYQDKKVDEKSIDLKFSASSLKAELLPILRTGENAIISGKKYVYKINIYNSTDKEIKNAEITINKNDLIEINNIDYSTGELEGNVQEGNTTFTIPSIPAKEAAYIEVDTTIKQAKNELQTADMSISVKDSSGKTYRSNKLSEKVTGATLEASISSTANASGYLHPGEEIKYMIKVKNTGKIDANNIEIEDRLSDYIELSSVTLNGKECEYKQEEEYAEGANYSNLKINTSLKAGEELTLVITAKVDEELFTEEVLKVVNKALIYDEEILITETNENVTYIESMPELINNDKDDINENNKKIEDEAKQEELEEQEEINENNEQKQENKKSNEEETNNNNIEENLNQPKYVISGTVWSDNNENGTKDSGETYIEGIKVFAINVSNNKIATDNKGTEISAMTNSEGLYTLANMPKGEYIIAFEYDTEKYVPTIYQAEGVSQDKNSDAVRETRTVNGEQKTLAFTDSIKLEESKANIDLGLAQAKVFDLDLEKVVSKMIVTNSEGTKTYEFDDVKLAKTEIKSKNLSGSNVVIEYKMKITNNGQVAGYAKKIVDHMPSSLQFNSSINKGWYKQGNDLYNTSLTNTKIEPGETKEVTLTLTKAVTETNTGLTNNKAEIITSYNALGIEDSDSKTEVKTNNTTNSKIKQDIGSADILVSPSTGATVSYIVLVLTIIIIIGGAAYLVNKKVLTKKIKI